VDLALAGPQDTRAAGTDTITGVEAIDGSDFDDVLLGGAGFDLIAGLARNDRIDGRSGRAVLVGDAGDDQLRGGADIAYFDGRDGHDTIAFDGAPGPVQVELGSPAPQDVGGFGDQTLLNVEGVIGSSFGDHLTGTPGPDAIDGGGGPDTIAGGEGADRLGGGAGIDTIDSRDSSPDAISCGAGPDSLSTDALDKLAADCLSVPAPVPPAAGGDGSSGIPAATGGDGSAAPALAVAVPRQSRRSVLAHGLRVLLRCSTECRASGRLVVARATALRLALGTTAASRRLGRLGPVTLPAATQRAARVRLSRRARAALRRAPAVRATLRARPLDRAGHAGAVVRKRVKLR
jgi:hypothetical protein